MRPDEFIFDPRGQNGSQEDVMRVKHNTELKLKLAWTQ